MDNAIIAAIADLARLRRIDLRPDWADGVRTPDAPLAGDDEAALADVCEAIGWAPAVPYAANPQAHEFPLLAFHPRHGWGAAERVEADSRLRVVQRGLSVVWDEAGAAALYDLVIPLPAGRQQFARAFDVFKAAVFRRKHVFVVAAAATIVVNIIALVTGLFSMQVYDRVVPSGAFSTLWVLAVGTIVALLFDFTLRVIRANLLERESADVDTEVSEFFFSRAAEIRLDARSPSVGTMAAQLRGLESVRQVMSSTALFAFADLPFALIFIVVIALLGGVIATVLLGAFVLAIALAVLFAWRIQGDTGRSQVTANRKNGLLVEALDGAETIKANRGNWYMLSRWTALVEELHVSELPVKRLQAMSGTIFGTLQQISYVGLIAWGAVEVFEGHITMGALVACSIISSRVNGPLIGQLPGLLVQWSYARASLKLLDGILAMPVDRPATVELLRPGRLAPALSLNGVSFAYPGARAGIQVPQLEIAAGERIGIIGGVGSGKSTLLKLLSGLYAPGEGQVLMDRLDMGQIAEDVLRHHVGYLPQDYRLVNGSLRDNLLLGLPDPGDEAIMDMARQTGLAALITAHPRGLDLPISEGGRGLSGGQRVLTGLTRLLLARPRLLLLDEPTANLDVETEANVLRALQRHLDKETTLIIVTHKLQLVGMVQRLMVVAGGRIVIDGPARDVVARLQRPRTETREGGAGEAPGRGSPDHDEARQQGARAEDPRQARGEIVPMPAVAPTAAPTATPAPAPAAIPAAGTITARG